MMLKTLSKAILVS